MKAFLKITGLLLGGIVVLAAIAAGIGIALGYIYVGVKQPAESVALRTIVCSDADIQKYNSFVTTFPANEEEQKQKAANMQAQIDDLKKKANFEQDATCVFMEYSAAVAGSKVDVAKAAYEKIAAFSEKSVFPSNKLLDAISLDSMQARIDALNGVKEGEMNPLGWG